MTPVLQQFFNNISAVKDLLEGLSPTKVLLVCGKKSFFASGAKSRLDQILATYQVVTYQDFNPNPDLDDILRGSAIFSDFEPDIVIAIGGGSVMDTAKLIASISEDAPKALIQIKENKASIKPRVKLVAVPTTAGSGSESTHFAVVYVGNKKFSVAHHSLLPEFVVLDPSLTHSMSPYLTASTGMDALCQAIESLWAVGATESSRTDASEAIGLIRTAFPAIVHKPDPEQRKLMLKASNLAGRAINVSKTTAAHAVSYAITKLYNVPHGHAVGLTLPFFLEFNLGNNQYPNRLPAQTFLAVKENILSLLDCKTVVEAKEYLQHLMIEAGLKTSLSSLGATDHKDIDKIVQSVNIERLGNNPKEVPKEVLQKIVEHIW